MLDLRNTKEGTKLHHHVHGIVLFVKFNYGTCLVKKQTLPFNAPNFVWECQTVITQYLVKYNQKKHGKILDMLK